MNINSGRKRPQTILLVLLILAILVDRYLIAELFPWAPGLAGVNPIIVFLDIPVHLPVIFDLPVIGLFLFFYWILLLSYPSRYGGATWQELRKRLWGVFTGALAILLCLAAGGGIYSISSGLMSREVRNGIDSFGIQADLYTPIPDHEIIHLRGSMILLVCLLIGVRIFIKKTNRVKVVPELHELREGIVDPSIAGFQEKGGVPEREMAMTGASIPGKASRSGRGSRQSEREVTMSGRVTRPAQGSRPAEREAVRLPERVVMPPRVKATPVSVVAPMPVEVH